MAAAGACHERAAQEQPAPTTRRDSARLSLVASREAFDLCDAA
jgi:hypothetical protein